jgi:hypothetical protein
MKMSWMWSKRLAAALLALTVLLSCGALTGCAAKSGAGQTSAAASGSASYENAKKYIGAEAKELLAAIGQPKSQQYADSCLGKGQDGQLVYDGFTVYTYRDPDGGETVSDVQQDS